MGHGSLHSMRPPCSRLDHQRRCDCYRLPPHQPGLNRKKSCAALKLRPTVAAPAHPRHTAPSRRPRRPAPRGWCTRGTPERGVWRVEAVNPAGLTWCNGGSAGKLPCNTQAGLSGCFWPPHNVQRLTWRSTLSSHSRSMRSWESSAASSRAAWLRASRMSLIQQLTWRAAGGGKAGGGCLGQGRGRGGCTLDPLQGPSMYTGHGPQLTRPGVRDGSCSAALTAPQL